MLLFQLTEGGVKCGWRGSSRAPLTCVAVLVWLCLLVWLERLGEVRTSTDFISQ